MLKRGRCIYPDGTALEGSNRYIYALRDDTIDVRFADGANAGARFVDLSCRQRRMGCGHCNRVAATSAGSISTTRSSGWRRPIGMS